MVPRRKGRFIVENLKDQRIIVTGGSAGLGLGLVEALVERGAKITVVARAAGPLAEVKQRFGVSTVAGDITDRALAGSLLRELRPDVVVLNAGATPQMLPLHEQSWEAFSEIWNTDVKAGLHWMQEALRLPLARGSRVLVSSSGAAIGGSPLSGGYAGAKRMLWLMANYANGVSAQLDLGIRFQVLVPQQMIGDTHLGHTAAQAYARHKGVTVEAFLAGFGKPLPPRQFGEQVVKLLTDPGASAGTAYGFKGDTGMQCLDSPAP